MGSSLFAEARRAGRAEGEIATARSICTDLAKQHHATTLPQVAAVIRTCRDPGVLHQWALAAPRVSDEEFLQLVLGSSAAAPDSPKKSSARTGSARAARPWRRAKPSRRR